jgi:hypothetical protein
VKQVESMAFGDLGHPGSESQRIRRVQEEGISGDFHLVIEDARRIGVEADGIGIANKVDFVSAMGKLQAKFSSYNTASAVGRVASDTDSHVVLVWSGIREGRMLVYLGTDDRACHLGR